MPDDALFELESEAEPTPGSAPSQIAKWQVDLLRRNFDARGLSSMHERRTVVERVVGRGVLSLNELSMAEAYAVLRHLGDGVVEDRRTTTSSSSTWDERDAETWIDRL